MANSKIKEATNSLKDSWKDLWKWIYLVIKWTWTWVYNVLKLWYRWVEAGDKALAKKINKKEHNIVIKYLSDKILRGIAALWIAGWLVFWWNALKWKVEDIFQSEWVDRTEFLWDDQKVFWVDVSRFNTEGNVDKFTDWWDTREKDADSDKRRPRFVYILWRKEKGQDPMALTHLANVKEHQSQLTWNTELAVWCYAYFDKSRAWITDEGLEKQVNEFIKVWEIINKEWDWLIDLSPMLDFEFSWNETVKRASSPEGKEYKKAILKWLKLFEKKTGVIPGIYANASTYKDYFYWDPAFSRYFSWIACYNDKMVDQERWIVTFQGAQMEADIIQFSKGINDSWFWTTIWKKIDGNTSTKWKFWKLIQDNDDAPKTE